MAIPEEVDELRIVVLKNGAVQFDKDYPIGPGGRAKLPATLAVAHENPGNEVDVRIIASLDGEARTLSRLITTVPKERVALLYMPLQWLCLGEVQEVEGQKDTYESTCSKKDGGERACFAGSCDFVSVESAELPDFDWEEVYGGGETAEEGTCFDTLGCFDAGRDVAPDDDCLIRVDSDEVDDVSIGLRLPQDGGGICSDDGKRCYVPIDRDDKYGWRIDDESKDTTVIQVPRAVCERIGAGDVQSVRVTTACQQKTLKRPTCGPWSSVEEMSDVAEGAGGGAGSDGGGSGGGGGGGTGGSGGSGGGGVGGDCEPGAPVPDGTLLLLATEATNYTFSSQLSWNVTSVAPDTELSFDWSDATADLVGRTLDPGQDVGSVEVLLFTLTPDELKASLERDTLQQADLATVLTFYPDAGVTNASLFEFGSPAMPLTEDEIAPFFDPASYDPASYTYLALLTEGMVLGEGVQTLQPFQLDPNSTNTDVFLTADSTMLDYDVDLRSHESMIVPQATADMTLDWSELATNAMGDPWQSSVGLEVAVARYSLSLADLEDDFAHLEAIADDIWRAPALDDETLSLAALSNEDGVPFDGIDGEGTWLLGLLCTSCQNPAPLFLTTLESCGTTPGLSAAATGSPASSTTTTTATTTTGGMSTAAGAGGATSTMNATSTTSSAGSCMASAAATGPVPINPVNGWVACADNTIGIEGAFFTYSDGISSTIAPLSFDAAGSDICVSGTVGQVVDGDYSVYGSGVGFNFADEASWDAAAQGISGVSFTISALPAIATRIIFTTSAGDHCAVIPAAGANTFQFTDTTLDCFQGGGASPAANDIIAVKWQVTTDALASYAFDFCITDLQAIP